LVDEKRQKMEAGANRVAPSCSEEDNKLTNGVWPPAKRPQQVNDNFRSPESFLSKEFVYVRIWWSKLDEPLESF
jgi:hypothetical protein